MSTKASDAEFLENNHCWRSELRLSLVMTPKSSHGLIGSYTAILYDLIVELVSYTRRRRKRTIKPHVFNRFKLSESTQDVHTPKHGKIAVKGVVNR